LPVMIKSLNSLSIKDLIRWLNLRKYVQSLFKKKPSAQKLLPNLA
jgi:hypothetical protein